VLLRLPADRFIRGRALIVRREVQKGRSAFALAFSGLRADQEQAIQEAVAAALDEARTAAVLILDDDIDLTQALRDSMSSFGYRSFPVASFLELVHALGRPNSVCIAFVADRLSRPVDGWAEGSQVLEYLAGQPLLWVEGAALSAGRRSTGSCGLGAGHESGGHGQRDQEGGRGPGGAGPSRCEDRRRLRLHRRWCVGAAGRQFDDHRHPLVRGE
jgi:hypothetical protein